MEQNSNDQSLRDAVRDAMQDAMRDQHQMMQQMLQTMQAMMARMEVQNRAQPIRREQQRRDVGLPRYVDQPPFLKNLETPPIQREQQRRDVGLPSSGKCQIIHWRQGHNEECHPPHVDDKYHGQTNISDPKGEPVEQPNVSDSSLEFEEQPRAKAVETHLKRPSSESNCSTNIITEDKPEDKPAVDASETESTSDSFDSSTPSSSTFSGITETSDDGSTTTGENRKNSEAKPDDGISDSSDQNSPRGVLEIPVSSADSDGSGSGSSETSLVDRSIATDGSVLESHSLQWKNLIGGLILRKKRSIMRLSTFPPATGGLGLQRTQSEKDKVESGEITTEIGRGRPSWRSFDYQELAAATDNFSPDKLIGKGGYAEFYRGCLADGQIVAVKRLTKKDNEERIGDFLSELGIIAHVNHPNAAQLLGFSVEGGLHLVLRFSPHGSLASVLHGLKEGLEWKVRFKIALGIAEGLLYLHEGCQRRIIHRDIKASNILLTEDFQPQISDFGLAKWLPDKWTHHIVFPIEGTFGYLAPEYFMHGVVNEKIDVFAFGVLLLELTTGRRAVDSSRQSLVIWAKPLLDANNVKELADPSPGDAYDPEEMRRSLLAASMCIHHLSTSRPDMNWVVRLLKGEEGSAELMGRELRPKLARPPLFDASDSEMRGNKSFSFRLISNQDEVYYTYEILDSSIISPLVLSKQGEVERFVWSNLSNYWNRYWYAPKDPCDSYASCGPNGVCNVSDPFFCQCLRGFHSKSTMDWNLNIYSGGCVRRTGLDFQSDGFSELQNVKLPDISNATADRNKSLDECREWCLKNFSCVAFAISGGNGCVSWTGNLIDIRVFAEGGENLFVRLAASELDTIKGDSSKKKHVIVIVIPLLLGFLLLVFIGLFILKRKSKPGITSDSYFEERKAEDLELPLFDMSMIENATNDFSSNNKLGEGGFGPVYKGQLRDGQEIAAKRLSKDSSQGLDEFKLEVKLFRGRGE